MTITVMRNGAITLNEIDCTNKYDHVQIEGMSSPVTIVTLDDGIYVVREADESEVKLVIFKQNKCLKPRVMTLHELPAGSGRLDLIHGIFKRLLCFDGNRLSNRDRNIAITIIRSFLPQVVRGNIDREDGSFRFYLYNDLISIFDHAGECMARLGYTSFSRTIKDRL